MGNSECGMRNSEFGIFAKLTFVGDAKPTKVYVNSERISLCLKGGRGQGDSVPLSLSAESETS